MAASACSDSSSGAGSSSGGEDSGTPVSDAATHDVVDASAADVSSMPMPEAAAEASGMADASDSGEPGDATGPSDAGGDAAGPTCGPPPARYTILTGADMGLVRDNVTMLVWMQDSMGGGEPPQTQSLAATYCTGRGMRLPTKDEAVALAANYAMCAFGNWGTWTSTDVPGMSGYAYVVDFVGDVNPQISDNFPSAVLCVRDPAG
jgi:hypothetical protein